jgi:hypothetical protein
MKAFLISGFIHLGVLSFFLFTNGVFKNEVPEVVEVEFNEIVKIKKAGQAGRKTSKRGSKLDVAEFFPSISNSSLLGKVQNNTEWAKAGKMKPENEFNNSSTFRAGAEDMFGEGGDNKNWSYYQEIYRRIDSHLMFDSLLAQYGHFGQVYVQFKVTPDGVFMMEDLRTDASDSILKVHVLRAIKKSLSESVDKTKFAKVVTPTLFKASFAFTLAHHENNFYTKQSDFGRPVLKFTRATSEKQIPRELMDHLLSGGISHNPFVMAERWQKYNKRKYRDSVQFDPFASYKRDVFYNL